ncbi:hypothetical protein PINS_up017001 [Pythium insidiosum]|nr:hypothetical protein PINS_up017001 [Pythium insidiosum]
MAPFTALNPATPLSAIITKKHQNGVNVEWVQEKQKDAIREVQRELDDMHKRLSDAAELKRQQEARERRENK